MVLLGQGQSVFLVAHDGAEHQICEKLKYKLDDSLELENYDWLLVEPKGLASSFIANLRAYFSVRNLPVSVSAFIVIETAIFLLCYCGQCSDDGVHCHILSMPISIYILHRIFTKGVYIALCNFYVNHEYMNPEHHVRRVAEFYTAVPNIDVFLNNLLSVHLVHYLSFNKVLCFGSWFCFCFQVQEST
jgi:hypothetical protein